MYVFVIQLPILKFAKRFKVVVDRSMICEQNWGLAKDVAVVLNMPVNYYAIWPMNKN
jgi:hypothetical protein